MIFNAFVVRIPKNLITINSMIEVLLDLAMVKVPGKVANAEWSGTDSIMKTLNRTMVSFVRQLSKLNSN
jgi:hypothetical protein